MKHKKVINLLVFSVLIPVLFSGCTDYRGFFAGRFTENDDSSGLYFFEMNGRNGEIRKISEFNVGPNPSFFCLDRESNIIYIINEVTEFNGDQGGGLSTFRYETCSGSLKMIGELRIPFGGPCHISLTPEKDYLLIANYQNASVLAVRLDENKIPDVACLVFL